MRASVARVLTGRIWSRLFVSQTGTQTEEEIKQEAYESGAKQTDLDAFEQVVEDVCEEIGDYLKTLQKSDASVYYFASSDKERVTESGG